MHSMADVKRWLGAGLVAVGSVMWAGPAAADFVTPYGSTASPGGTGTVRFVFDFDSEPGNSLINIGSIDLTASWDPAAASLAGVSATYGGSDFVDLFSAAGGQLTTNVGSGLATVTWISVDLSVEPFVLGLPIDLNSGGTAEVTLTFDMLPEFTEDMWVSLSGSVSDDTPDVVLEVGAGATIEYERANVPEPASLALTLAGLGLLGAHAARRRVRAIA